MTTVRRAVSAAVVGVMLASMPALTASAAGLTGQTLPPSPRAGSSAHGAGLAGFQPGSASFISPSTGFVLGTGPCGLSQVCRARLVGTTDGGAHWHRIGITDVPFGDLGRGRWVTGVAFVNRRVGWLYGSGLWVTRDAGAHWRKLSLGGQVQNLAASSGRAYAVVEPVHSRTGSELFTTPIGTNAWQRVGTFTGDYLPNWLGGFAVLGRSAWFATAGAIWTSADGTHWHKYPFACKGAGYGLFGIAAASPARVRFLCLTDFEGLMAELGVEIMASTDGGKTEHLSGRMAPLPGDGGAIAVPPGNAKVITFDTSPGGAAWIGRSVDGGKTWKQVANFRIGGSWDSLSYVSATAGWIVLDRLDASGITGVLLRTTDAGRSWHKVHV